MIGFKRFGVIFGLGVVVLLSACNREHVYNMNDPFANALLFLDCGISQTCTTTATTYDITDTGMSLWLKPDSGLSENSGTITWTDSSGQGNNTTGLGTLNTGTLNGYNTVSFNGTSNNLAGTTTNGMGTDSFSIFAAFRINTASNHAIIEVGAVTGQRLRTNASNQYEFLNSGVSIATTSSLTASTSTYTIMNLSYDGSGVPIFYQNGVSETNPLNSVSYGGGAGFTIGSTSAPGDFFSGEIVEVIYYPLKMTDSNRVEVECYLSLKFGIGVSTSC